MLTACDHLSLNGYKLLWGPGRHGIGHNLFAYHRAPNGLITELFAQLDQMNEALGHFEPRPWHRDRPQKPKVWAKDPNAVELLGYHADRRDAQIGNDSCTTRAARIDAPLKGRKRWRRFVGMRCARSSRRSSLHCSRSRERPRRAAIRSRSASSLALTGAGAAPSKVINTALDIWRDDVNAKGGLLGPPGRARHLRRPEHAGERAGHLHQADHRRQSRPAARALRHELRRAGDADHHPEQEADDQLHRDRHQRQIQLRQILLDGLGRSRRREFLLHRLLRHGGGAEAEAGDRRDPRRRRRVRPGRGAGRPRGDQEARLQARL